MRILLNTPHTPDTLVLQRLEPAEVSPEDPVDTRSRENDFLVQLELESLMHQHHRKPNFSRAHVELVGNLKHMRSWLSFDLETLISRGHYFRVQDQASLFALYKRTERWESVEQI